MHSKSNLCLCLHALVNKLYILGFLISLCPILPRLYKAAVGCLRSNALTGEWRRERRNTCSSDLMLSSTCLTAGHERKDIDWQIACSRGAIISSPDAVFSLDSVYFLSETHRNTLFRFRVNAVNIWSLGHVWNMIVHVSVCGENPRVQRSFKTDCIINISSIHLQICYTDSLSSF